MKTTALDKFLEKHKPTCTFWVYSGDRHCSCGRDAAIREVEELRNQKEQTNGAKISSTADEDGEVMTPHPYYNPDRKQWELIDPNHPDQATPIDRPQPQEGFTVHFAEDPEQWLKEFNQFSQGVKMTYCKYHQKSKAPAVTTVAGIPLCAECVKYLDDAKKQEQQTGKTPGK